MENLKRSLPWKKEGGNTGKLLTREWLVTNGLGGYASGSVSGAVTRRYHGFLISALPAPYGRMVMLNHLSETLILPTGESFQLSSEEKAEQEADFSSADHLTEFRLEGGLPVWRYEIKGAVIERKIALTHMQNTVHVNYKLISGKEPVIIQMRPSMQFRPHEAAVNQEFHSQYKLVIEGERYEVFAGTDMPSLKLLLYGEEGTFTADRAGNRELFYRLEAERGYESYGSLWSPGYFSVTLRAGGEATFTASTETWPIILALKPKEAFAAENERRKRLLRAANVDHTWRLPAELVLAADQFIITPAGRIEDAARARASGDELRTVIAGYHWFTDWGRDTMISLEGLTLVTGRYNEARWILRTFAHYIKDGLIPNMFPEGEKEGLYHTADATLWFFHAVEKYVEATGDRETLSFLLPKLLDIIKYHLNGTRFGIRVDHNDGLLIQGEEGYQLTWMDAKVENWVVTPRRGKAVEINALWYNALKLLEKWLRENGDIKKADELKGYADKARESFNNKFWYNDGAYLYDVIEGENGSDDACRPNQLFAIALSNPILNEDKWKSVLDIVEARLITPLGLRSLAPGHPDYKSKYFGDLRARDAAYHQGTVWGWLIGPFIDAWLKVNNNNYEGAKKYINGFDEHLNEACIGSISEVFDAESPFQARGCIAQAWSVAEVLRIIMKLHRKTPAIKEEALDVSIDTSGG
jgi:predicted glycogen debranching enzyme